MRAGAAGWDDGLGNAFIFGGCASLRPQTIVATRLNTLAHVRRWSQEAGAAGGFYNDLWLRAAAPIAELLPS
jgi:hypothetical protein